jgi:beta propeller repeat protein
MFTNDHTCKVIQLRRFAKSYSLDASQSDGHLTVGMTYVNEQWEIALKDLTTGRTNLLTSDPLAQGYPDINGSYIVYQQEVINAIGNQLGFNIMLMNIESGEVEKISTKTTHNIYPKINEKYIVWREFERIILYDRTSKEMKEIGSEDARSFGVHLSEDQIVWMDVRSGHFDIYLQEANSELEIQITNSDVKQSDPYVSNGVVVWHDYRDGNRQIYSYNTITEQEQLVVRGTTKDFKNGILLYRSGSEIKVRDIQNGAEKTVDNSVKELVLVNGSLYTLGDEITSVPSLKTSSDSSSQTVKWEWVGSDQGDLQVYSPSNIQISSNAEPLTSKEGIKDTLEIVGDTQYTITNRPHLNSNAKYRFAVSSNLEEALLHKVMGFDDQKQQWVELESVRNGEYLYFSPETTDSYVLVKYTHTFNDMNAHWANASVQVLASKVEKYRNIK